MARVTVRCVPLRYVDPHKKRGRWYKANVGLGRSRVGQFVARHIARHTDPYLFRLTGGRVNMGAIINAPLISTGAKSGEPRVVQLTYFHDGPDVILLGSNYGGTKHPQWYYNLKAHPECEFGGESFSASQVTSLTNTHGCTSSPSRSTPGTAITSSRRLPPGGRFPSSGSSHASGAALQTDQLPCAPAKPDAVQGCNHD